MDPETKYAILSQKLSFSVSLCVNVNNVSHPALTQNHDVA